ncbi:MAG TPA: redoxin domain-containing protein [Candidatus Saccharimonadia bacterium]
MSALENPVLGTLAPNFSLQDQSGAVRNLYHALRQKSVFLFFYPYDQSPSCTKQLCTINNELTLFQKDNLVAWGINNASAESHKLFADTRRLNLPLLSDEGYEVSRKYDSLFSFGPIKVIRRTVVGISRDRKITFYAHGDMSLKDVLNQLI